ncbi:MAG TPA: ABC transporter ATP-binding protein [Gemmatimonadaceae bacterium]|nr:ABC transporter ATP-binding protein [Gemmatimonadaceae bacterium]
MRGGPDGARPDAWHDDAAGGRAATLTSIGAMAPSDAFLQLARVGKTYRGLRRRVDAVVDVTLDIRRGEVVGLAGPNGAGKSTLIALLLGFLKPTSGTITIGGLSPRHFVERHGVGYLSELVIIPPRWRMEEALSRYALLAGIEPSRVRRRVVELVEELGLAEHWGKQIRQLSKGNLQRVGLAQALLHDEQLVILDEPTHGLDPVWTQRFRDIVHNLRSADRAIFIASHNLDELQRVADRVAIIDHGRVQRVVQTKAATHDAVAVPYRLLIATGIDVARAVLAVAREVAPGELELPAMSVESLNESLSLLLSRGVLVASVAPLYSSLERQFRDAVQTTETPKADPSSRSLP